MKKVALSLIALLAAGSFAFAEDVAVEKNAAVSASLSASATVKYGIDLDTKLHGFNQGEDFDLNLTIIPDDSTSSKSGEKDGAKVEITIGDVSIYRNSDDAGWTHSIGDITAKITIGDLYIKLHENTDPSVGYGVDGGGDSGGNSLVGPDESFYTYSARYGATGTEWATTKITSYSAFDGTGVEVGYTIPGTVSLVGQVASHGDWTSNTTGYEGKVTVGLLAVEKLTLNLAGYIGSTDNYEAKKTLRQAAGLNFAYDLGVVAPFANVNAQADRDGETKDGEWVSDFGAKLPLVDGFNSTLYLQYNSASVINAVYTANLESGKLAGPLGLLAGVKLGDLTTEVKANKTTEIFGKVTYTAGDVGVWGKFSRNSSAEDKSDSLFLKAGVDVANVLPLTTIGAEWDSNDFGSAETTKAWGTLGQLFTYVKVAY